IREEAIKANYENGVLKLVLPKTNEETPSSRRIEIE
ncbi:MAG: Hsp20 family protein, partial [Christensenellaceae bacterium]|nr:Hsp20 family protein [Christensenellaceae bacterium]